MPVPADIEQRKALARIRREIREHERAAAGHDREALEHRLAIGSLLLEARERFPSDREFGQWAKESVGYSGEWRRVLMDAARNADAIRRLLDTTAVARGVRGMLDLVRQRGERVPSPAEVKAAKTRELKHDWRVLLAQAALDRDPVAGAIEVAADLFEKWGARAAAVTVTGGAGPRQQMLDWVEQARQALDALETVLRAERPVKVRGSFQPNVLRFLADQPDHRAPKRAVAQASTAMTHYAGLSTNTSYQAINRLLALGLLEEVEGPGRGGWVQLTDAGRDAAAEPVRERSAVG